MRPECSCEWWLRVCYRSEDGDLDIDYMVSSLEEAYLAIRQGPGVAAIKTIQIDQRGEAMTLEALDKSPSERERGDPVG